MSIGRTLILGFEGTRPEHKDVQSLSQLILMGQVGGVILFKHNIETPAQVHALMKYFNDLKGPSSIFCALDEEGGIVQRLKGPGFKNFLSAKEVSSTFSPEEAYHYYKELAQNLHFFGFNLNLAPVVDLDPIEGALNEILGARGRTFGSDPGIVSAYARAHILAHTDVGIYTAAKHFPGHGRAHGDTHERAVDISATWTEEEMEPYKALVGSTSMIMLSHLSHSILTQGCAGPFSSHLIGNVLRKSLGFEGLVITDDLFMQGAAPKALGRSGVKAIESGCDLLIYSYHPALRANMEGSVPSYEALIGELESACLTNSHLSGQLEKALTRIESLTVEGKL